MYRITLSRSSGLTISGWFSTRDTVAGDTFAFLATSSIFTLECGRTLGSVIDFLSITCAQISRSGLRGFPLGLNHLQGRDLKRRLPLFNRAVCEHTQSIESRMLGTLPPHRPFGALDSVDRPSILKTISRRRRETPFASPRKRQIKQKAWWIFSRAFGF